ncbi:hypothetical protein [Saccharopolyspora shandongensis]
MLRDVLDTYRTVIVAATARILAGTQPAGRPRIEVIPRLEAERSHSPR